MSVEEKKVEEAQDAAEVEPRPQETVAKPPVIETPKDLNYEEMLEAYNESFKGIVEGAVVPGTVLKISESHVVVDVGFKSEGRIALSEFRDEEGNLEVKPGDKVDVLLERTEDRHGYVVVSRQKAERMKIWDALDKNYQDQSIITGRVIERVKGGLAVDVGVRAFLPGSQVDVQPTRNLDSWRKKASISR